MYNFVVWTLTWHILTLCSHYRVYGNQSFTIVQPGNVQRLTSCDNTLKCSVTSFTDCTVPQCFFEVRCFQSLDSLSVILTEKLGQWVFLRNDQTVHTSISSIVDQSGCTILFTSSIFSFRIFPLHTWCICMYEFEIHCVIVENDQHLFQLHGKQHSVSAC